MLIKVNLKFIYTVVCFILISLYTSAGSYQVTDVCAVDLCLNKTGYCEELFKTIYYVLENNVTFLFPDLIKYRVEEGVGLKQIYCNGPSTCTQLCRSIPSTCSGSAEYCLNYNCSYMSSCNCDLKSYSQVKYIEYEGVDYKIKQENYTTLYECDGLTYSKRSVLGTAQVIVESCVIYTQMEANSIKFSVSPQSTGIVRILYRGHDFKIIYNTSDFQTFNVPLDWLTSTGVILVDFFGENTACSAEIPLVAKYQCPVEDCFLCTATYTHYRCLPSSYKTVFWLMLIICITLILFCAPYVGVLIFYIISSIFSLIKFLFRLITRMNKLHVYKKIKTKVSNMKQRVNEYAYEQDNESTEYIQDPQQYNTVEDNNRSNNEELPMFDENGELIGFTLKQKNIQTNYNQYPRNVQEDEEVIDTSAKSKKSSRKIVGFKAGRPIFGLFVCFLFVCNSTDASCTQGLTIGSQNNVCFANGTILTCRADYNVYATVNTVGSQYCFSLSANNTIKWSGYIQHLGIIAELDLRHEYYTSGWTGFAQSSHACDWTSLCSGGCSGLQSRDGGGALTDERLKQYPGVTICHDSCGCATCDGCVSCSPSCLYSGFGIKPLGPIYQIYSIANIKYTPYILVHLEGENLKYHNILTPTINPVRIGNFSVNLIGAYSLPTVSLGEYKVLRDLSNNDYYFTVATITNQLTAGIVGDIQAGSIESFQTLPMVFKYGPIWTRIPGDYQDEYRFLSAATTTTRPNWKKLPTLINSHTWIRNITTTMSGQTFNLLSNITGPPAFGISLTTPVGLNYSTTVNVVCPTFIVVNASGCYSCSYSSIIKIKAKSTCNAGLVSVTADDASIIVYTTSILLSQTDENFEIIISTNKASNNFNLKLSSTFSNFTQPVKFTAIRVDEVVYGNDTVVVNPTDNTNGISDDLYDFSSSWYGIILWVVIAIIAVLLILYLLRWCLINKPYTKYIRK